jgi:glyoxylase-like metal-dependent hydrolase (beta-lactamase superfamily II)
MASPAIVKLFHDPASHTAQYVVSCSATKKCAIMDSVLDYNHGTGITGKTAVEDLIAYVKAEGLTVEYILETHAHADHISAAPLLKELFGGKTGVGEHIKDVQALFIDIFNITDLAADGSCFDVLFKDGDTFNVGNLVFNVMHTPGHTPACICYHIAGDAIFTGDTMFCPDQGTARCDFPGGSSETLWNSIQKILALPDATRVFTCHDYAPGGREYCWESTVAAEKAGNIHVKSGTDADQFKKWRAERDATLSLPGLILPSVQMNIRAGGYPTAESNGVSYVKVPLDIMADIKGWLAERQAKK